MSNEPKDVPEAVPNAEDDTEGHVFQPRRGPGEGHAKLARNADDAGQNGDGDEANG